MNKGFETIRETVLGECIGATILNITATDKDEFLSGEKPIVYFHPSNGKTIFATMGIDGEDLMGILDDEAART